MGGKAQELPPATAAAVLEAGDDMAQVGLLAGTAHNGSLDEEDGM